MPLTVVSVAYPFAPVGRNAAGGAEQILALLDEGLVREGHRSIVVACEGSEVKGELEAVAPPLTGRIDASVREATYPRVREAVNRMVASRSVDIVHMHGLDFENYLPREGPPVVVTLHLPPSWYSGSGLRTGRKATFFQPVSRAQARTCPPDVNLMPVIENGVPVEELDVEEDSGQFVLSVGRICPEKGYHLAIEAAKKAGITMLLAGVVYPYEAHERYYRDEIAPRLGTACRYIGPAGFERKRRLMTAARAVLIPSLVEETSSLVAMEALACGTPVIASRKGAHPEIIEEGKTGFLVDSIDEMAAAIGRIGAIWREDCRESARRRFSADRMVRDYLNRYEELVRTKYSRERGDASS